MCICTPGWDISGRSIYIHGDAAPRSMGMKSLLRLTASAAFLVAATFAPAQTPDVPAQPIPSPSIPAGPRPTATVSPIEASPEPTSTVTPLPSASPSGTQPQTTNTVTPTPAG